MGAGDIRRAEGRTSAPYPHPAIKNARSARSPDIKMKRGDTRHRFAATNVLLGRRQSSLSIW